MLKSESSKSGCSKSGRSKFIFLCGQPCSQVGVAAWCLLVFLALPSLASAQGSFTLQAPSLSEVAIAPGGTSSANITVGSVNGFSGTVTLSCTVATTTGQTPTDPPECAVSPATVTPPTSASATITTKSDTSTVSYNIVITGNAPSTGETTSVAPLTLTVLAVSAQFTITIDRPVTPSSVPAGSGGQGVVSINPINGYITPPGSPGITLSCSSISPLVTLPPTCSFNPPVVPLTSANPVTSNISISTFGPITTSALVHPRAFYALWLPIPMLSLAGLGAAVGGKRSRKAWGLLALFVISGALFLMPACGNTSNMTTTPNGITPNNTYSFVVSGVDSNGVISSNGGTITSSPTVSLTVTSPTN